MRAAGAGSGLVRREKVMSSQFERRTLRRFAAWYFTLAILAFLVFGSVFAGRSAMLRAQDSDDVAVITIKAEDRTLTIKFKNTELGSPDLAHLVKERVLKEECKNPKKISDDCWSCDGGRVICTKNDKLRSVLSVLLRRNS
jgi:hypothetical protein